MAILASIFGPAEPDVGPSALGPQVDLSEPTDIQLAPGAAGVVSYDKVGPDLVLRLANGETSRIDNFFEAGPNGDFSRLLTASGEVVASGLMAPEPDYPDEPDAVLAAGAGESISGGATVVEGALEAPSDGADADGLMSGSFFQVAGAGLFVGSGIAFGSDSDDSTDEGSAPSVADAQQVDADLLADALLGPEGDLAADLLSSELDVSESYDVASDPSVSEPAEPPSDEANTVEAGQPQEAEGYILPETAVAEIAESGADLLADLDMEFTV